MGLPATWLPRNGTFQLSFIVALLTNFEGVAQLKRFNSYLLDCLYV